MTSVLTTLHCLFSFSLSSHWRCGESLGKPMFPFREGHCLKRVCHSTERQLSSWHFSSFLFTSKATVIYWWEHPQCTAFLKQDLKVPRLTFLFSSTSVWWSVGPSWSIWSLQEESLWNSGLCIPEGSFKCFRGSESPLRSLFHVIFLFLWYY